MNFWKRYPCRPHTPSHPPGISLQHFFLSWDSQRRWGRAPKKTKKGVAFFPPKQRGGRSFPYPIYKICSKTKWEPLPPPIVCPFTTHWKYKIQEPWQINEPDTIRPCHDMWIQTCHKNTWTNYSPMWMWKWHRESRPSPISLPVTQHRQNSHVGLHRVPVPPGMWLRSQLANFSHFWSKFCHLWNQCKSSEKMLPCMGGRGLYYSGTAVQMPQLQEVSAHFSQFRVGPVSSLTTERMCLHTSGKWIYLPFLEQRSTSHIPSALKLTLL